MTQMASNGSHPSHQVVVLMVPFPIQGHLNQLLHLSRLISAYSIPVHYVGTTRHNLQAQRRVHGWNPLSNSTITFHQLPLPSQFIPPNPNSPIKFPSHLQPLFDASVTLRQPVNDLLEHLCTGNRRVIIVYDSMMGSVVQDFSKFPNAECYTFHSISAFSIFFFFWENLGRPVHVDPKILEDLPSLEGCFTPEFRKFLGNQHGYLNMNSGRIYNTCRVVENKFLDLLAMPEITGNKKQWALGPFNPVNIESAATEPSSELRHRCLKWLDKQPPNSVIFVSFGTTTTLPEKQIHELAIGLEKSNQKFIWVVRDADPDGGSDAINGEINIKTVELPVRFEDRVKERGIIVRDWAPQLEILGHVATGGFMSHCGWNSCMETISMGVPVAAWPMHSDQPRNTVLLTKVLGISVVVKDWAAPKEEVVTAAVVEGVVTRLMASEEGDEMRKKAAELSGAVRTAVAEGGTARRELDAFISHITR